MCYFLYIGTDTALAVQEAREGGDALTISEIGYGTDPVRQHFSKRHVYFVSPDGHCSCDFAFSRAAWPKRKKIVQALVEVIERALASNRSVEVFFSWWKHEGYPPRRRLAMTPDVLLAAKKMPFRNRDFVVFTERGDPDRAEQETE
jgi:hypothetical protein